MTYIEFFDKVASKNISACLTYVPDRVVFIGDNSKLMQSHVENYRCVFRDRGQNIDFIVKTVAKRKLEDVVALLSDIVETYDDCVFDITGGEEMFNFALGIVFSKYPDRNIQIHQINIKNNMIYDCDKDGFTIYKETPKLSVDENIRIYGGEIVYGEFEEAKTHKWDLNPMFLGDIDVMWDICKKDVRLWNTQIGVIAIADEIANVSDDGLSIIVSYKELEKQMRFRRAKLIADKETLEGLLRHGILRRFEISKDGNLIISFKNKQIKRCLTAAGTILELKVFATALSLEDKDGKPVYNDALCGVVIDWDGELHEENNPEIHDTKNEIDIMLMHDIVPIFVSCKNGVVSADELYKLETVAERFGGPYSKKVLVATALDSLGEAGEYFRQRAEDMNIRIVENIQEMDDETLKSKLRNLWN